MSVILDQPLTADKPFPGRPAVCASALLGRRIAATQAMAVRLTDRFEIVAGALSSDPSAPAERPTGILIPPVVTPALLRWLRRKPAGGWHEAVMITTPNHLHFPAAKSFAEAGIHIMCDKPLTNEAGEADRLVLLVEQTGIMFTVGYVMSCFPMVRQAREIVASGQLGDINQIHVEFMQDWMTPPDSDKAEHVKWRLDPKASGPTSCTGDIGTHAAHLAGFVTGHRLTDVRAEFHVCGAPKPLEDTVFMSTRYDGRIPGTLMATRLAPGNRGGLRLRVFGSAGGLEWDLESCDQLKLNIFGRPDQTLSRGHGHGLSAATERLVRSGRGFPEGIIEAWANLYTEFAVAIAAQKDGVTAVWVSELPDGQRWRRRRALH